MLQAEVFCKTTQEDITNQCATHAGPMYFGKIDANKLSAITLAVIELKCHKNCKMLPEINRITLSF